ncbi:MAG: hypothetical protein LC772_10125, partial [Chloroflexi bacterium]|nr:hypothetical protein [Chloroflexota bacterium]
ELSREPRFNNRQPAVLVSHLYVQGARMHSAFRMTEANEMVFQQANIPAHFAYVAYGHIHKPQAALGDQASHVRYCGSIERLDSGEADDQKSVVLVDIGPEGRQSEPRVIPFADCDPIYPLEIGKNGDAAGDLRELALKYADEEARARALCRYTLYHTPGRDNLAQLCRDIHTLFPRWYSRQLTTLQADGEQPAPAPDLLQVRKNVVSYLESQLQDDSRKKQLLELADSVLQKGGY